MSNDHQPTVWTTVGVVGAGQLARMMGEAAGSLNVEVTVLATSGDDSAIATTSSYLLGSPDDETTLRELGSRVDVVTFDHELVDLELLARLEGEGVTFRPSPSALRYSVDKGYQRHAFRAAGLPVPRFMVVTSPTDPRLPEFLDELGDAPVVKATRGGYDGRGVHFPADRAKALASIEELTRDGEALVEERLILSSEVAQIVARSVDGTLAVYPVVDTVQRDGMCVEVRYPSQLDKELQAEARDLSERVAKLIKGVGIMAIEYFVTEVGLIVNEVALRPHNTGHWTIEGVATSQFTQHLLAVSGRQLGEVHPLSPFAVMVNVVGGEHPGSGEEPGDGMTFVHDYGKSWRPGRKLGHVTAVGDDPTDAHVRAWDGARAYGTMTQEA